MYHPGFCKRIQPIIWALGVLFFQCGSAAEPVQIYTVNYPLSYFAARIAGERAEVTFPAPTDVDPAFWVPDVDAIGAYQSADLILLNGADYAKWTAKVSLPRSRQVNTSAGFKDAYIPVQGDVSHSHGASGEHSHSGIAFTTWLDFDQAGRQAEVIADALARKRPDDAEVFGSNLQTLTAELMVLDSQVSEIVEADPERPLLASHPVYQYMARRYGLNLESVMWEPDQAPTDSQWQELEQLIEGHTAKWMLWEGEPLPETKDRLHALGIESIVFDPVGNRPESGDFMTVMAANLSNLGRVFR